MKKVGIIVLVVVVLALTGGLTYLILQSKPAAEAPAGSSFPSYNQIGVSIALSRAPRLNEPFFIYTDFTALTGDLMDMEGHVLLPSGAIYLDGDWKYRGPATRGRAVSLSTKAVIVEEGKWSITARAEAAGYKIGPAGQPETKPWYPIQEGVRTLNVTVGRAGNGSTGGMLRPQPKLSGLKAGDPEPIGMSGYIVQSELINNTDQAYFLLIHDKAGMQNLHSLGLVPQQLWGPWGPFQRRSLNDILHPDFNLNFIVLVVDKKRPTTGYRIFVENADRDPGGKFLNIRVRSSGPPPGITVTNKAVSPYDALVWNKDYFKQGQPVDVKFFLNGQLQSQQTLVIRKPGQGVMRMQDVYGGERDNLIKVAREAVARVYNVTAANLEQVPGAPYTESLPHLGTALHAFNFRDKSTGKSYTLITDAYGRAMAADEKDLPALYEVNRRAKLALGFDGLDPELEDLLGKQADSYVVPVDVWLRPTAPGTTFPEMGRTVIQALSALNAQPQPAANLPMLKASLTKKNILELAKRDEVAVIMKSRGN